MKNITGNVEAMNVLLMISATVTLLKALDIIVTPENERAK